MRTTSAPHRCRRRGRTHRVPLPGRLFAQDRAEFFQVDVSSRNHAHDLAAACFAGQGARHRAGPQILGSKALAVDLINLVEFQVGFRLERCERSHSSQKSQRSLTFRWVHPRFPGPPSRPGLCPRRQLPWPYGPRWRASRSGKGDCLSERQARTHQKASAHPADECRAWRNGHRRSLSLWS